MKTKFILSTVTLFLTFGIVYLSNSQAQMKQSHYDQSNIDNHFIKNKQTQQDKLDALINDPVNNTSLKNQVNSQNISSLSQATDDQKIFQQIVQNAINHNLSNKSMGEIMQVVAEGFLGAKYTAGLLDRANQETLIISLKEFDCLLFVETVLAISRSIALQEYNYQAFEQHIVEQRYWNGNLNGYCSRLHYFSEWIFDNQKRQNLEDISISLGGISQIKKLDFMSKHRNLYPRLINNNANYQCIVEMETNLSNQGIPTNYISKTKIKNIYQQLKPGDIIGVTTNIAGLDVTHTGLAYYSSDGVVGFIHASPIGKVTIASDLQNYVEKVPNSTGILVARPIDPRTKKMNL